MELNAQSSKSKTEYKEIKEEGNDRHYLKQEGNFISFVTDHAAFFIVLSILNFTLAVLITVFCFIFPNAFGNAKASVGRARDWALPKIDAGIKFGLELPSLGMNGVKIGGSFLAHPFNWLWSFLSCVGKCFGLRIPKINIS